MAVTAHRLEHLEFSLRFHFLNFLQQPSVSWQHSNHLRIYSPAQAVNLHFGPSTSVRRKAELSAEQHGDEGGLLLRRRCIGEITNKSA